jgi:Uma2 family endonuclease
MTPTSTSAVPPLVDGERLSREEFHRRYLAMPHVKKAELIEGVVYMPSPVSLVAHAHPHGLIGGGVAAYFAHTTGVSFGVEATLQLEGDNEVQPDMTLFTVRKEDGTNRVGADGYIDGGPELAIEVAASSSSRDRNAKKRVYLANGVREYIIWRTEAGVIDWFVLRDGKYEPLPLAGGVYKSEAFPGLWLDTAAMLRGDLAGVFAVLQQGMATPEHAAFVARLTPARP